jgi:hypothetical protein
VPDERQPGWAAALRLWSVVSGQHSADHVLVDIDAEGSPDDERDPRATEPWIALLESTITRMSSGAGPLGPGLPFLREEKSRRYFRFFGAS